MFSSFTVYILPRHSLTSLYLFYQLLLRHYYMQSATMLHTRRQRHRQQSRLCGRSPSWHSV